MEGYSAIVRDHFENPRNVGELAAPDGVARQTNPVCGDEIQLMLRVNDGKIADARFLINGCPASIAASSICTEMIIGRPLEEAEQLRKEEIVEALGGLPPSKLHGSVLAVEALRKAIADYRQRRAV
ncbi:MAG TPA: iron-sulfur cluster assembly scaffold protein [Dehalococcoidia bacterium]|nr:iron-sulfur cluster assembly scaffold protein [Dehalococcoidia bacterium]